MTLVKVRGCTIGCSLVPESIALLQCNTVKFWCKHLMETHYVPILHFKASAGALKSPLPWFWSLSLKPIRDRLSERVVEVSDCVLRKAPPFLACLTSEAHVTLEKNAPFAPPQTLWPSQASCFTADIWHLPNALILTQTMTTVAGASTTTSTTIIDIFFSMMATKAAHVTTAWDGALGFGFGRGPS